MRPRPAPAAIAADLLAGFPPALRQAGLPVDAGRAADFLRAARLCRLRGIGDLARIGRVTLTGSPEEFPLYDVTFESWFGAAPFAGRADGAEDDAAPRSERARNAAALLDVTDGDAAGQAASDEVLRNRRNFGALSGSDGDALARLRRGLGALPTMQRRAWLSSPAGRRIDMPRTARAARRTFGETLRLIRLSRPQRPRKLLLLIDVSGSMKAQSEAYLRFAHLATRQAKRVETFCFGTRLSRATGTLRHRDGARALAGLADIVFDFDGGTLIGRSFEEFLSVSRYTALVRGAVTIVFSDGLERGDPAAMIAAVERLARLSHRLVWVTPLAADPRYRPATRAMAGILPMLDGLFDGSGLPALERLLRKLDQVERAPRGQAGRVFPKPRA